ncbi:MAG: undecaprenyldiphospho-muramoylpentapeptide beta-N-acetylglucosaminyltransferase [Bacteroidetes bacterium]|nr:undecaprenyldiphospho-muramoylpentapeptide beta-N-acetylglucosaminyltransferase [Bacteroidota bacterium]
MKYLFAGGGTGGHIFPAIAIADEIRKLDSDASILFIGAEGRIEEKIVPQNGYKLKTIRISGIDRKNFFKNILLPLKVMRSITRSKEIIRGFKPDAAVGTGGFVCGPVIHSAFKMGIPVLIQEGNSFAGKTIKMLSERADRVVINFDETRKYLKRNDNVIKIPHPVRSTLEIKDRDASIRNFGLDPVNKTVLIFGGSQGARGINEVIARILPEIFINEINVIWQTGSPEYEKTKDSFGQYASGVKILKFIDKMDEAYSAADLVICRAGITSIMELGLLKKASILIPLPGSAEEHQVKNALSLKKLGAAEVILQQDAGENLLNEILRLLSDIGRLSELQKNISGIGDRDAAKKIAEEVIKLAGRN